MDHSIYLKGLLTSQKERQPDITCLLIQQYNVTCELVLPKKKKKKILDLIKTLDPNNLQEAQGYKHKIQTSGASTGQIIWFLY